MKLKKGIPPSKLKSLLKKWQNKLLLNDWDLSLKFVDFKRKDFKQSGDIKVDLKNKNVTVLMIEHPFLDEEETMVHELIHLILWDLDHFCEKIILKSSKKLKGNHEKYMDKLEEAVERLTQVMVNKKGQ